MQGKLNFVSWLKMSIVDWQSREYFHEQQDYMKFIQRYLDIMVSGQFGIWYIMTKTLHCIQVNYPVAVPKHVGQWGGKCTGREQTFTKNGYILVWWRKSNSRAPNWREGREGGRGGKEGGRDVGDALHSPLPPRNLHGITFNLLRSRGVLEDVGCFGCTKASYIMCSDSSNLPKSGTYKDPNLTDNHDN